ncbi:MAG: acyl-CoA dehydrogenase family protein [Acidobacteria bacterium]|nr:acyl-CoA dehydrogenase family protein [Acidobacteriota bacterium]
MRQTLLSPPPATHEVLNQPPALADYNLFTTDQVLAASVRRGGAGWAEPRLEEYGRIMGSEEAIRWGFQANENPPVLHTHDRFGHRRDEVEFHPAWHALMRLSLEHDLHSLPWSETQPGAHVARAALLMIASQTEAGHLCPLSMTCFSVPVIRREPALARQWEPRILSRLYDPRLLPPSSKNSALVGMAMTEKQGGSDVRANTTRAEPLNSVEYRITGHKWFCSAPMCDAFLALAQAPGGLSCFFLPRWTPEETKNHFYIQRLKNKLGNRSNASSEVEFDGAWAMRIGEEGRGVATIIEMVTGTRLDCIASSAGGMRQALTQAIHYARHRCAFTRLLADQPLMQNVLADLAIESEAATLLLMRLASAFDSRHTDAGEHGFARLATAAAKYWISKRAIAHVSEALECLGGNGYVEESILPRLYREMPVNSLWEGVGNVIALDILRAMATEPESVDRVLDEIRLGRGADPHLDAHILALEADLTHTAHDVEARRLAERIALALQGSLLVRHSIPAVADAFCRSRLGKDWGFCCGTLPAATPFGSILDRAAMV